MSERLPWYKKFPVEHLLAAADLSLESEGALMRMRDWSWIHGPLPKSPQEIATLLRAPKKSALIGELIHRFFREAAEGFVDPELEKQRLDAQDKSKKRATAGGLGAEARWHGKPIANAIQEPWQLPPYARSKISIGGISTDLREDSIGLEARKLSPAGGDL